MIFIFIPKIACWEVQLPAILREVYLPYLMIQCGQKWQPLKPSELCQRSLSTLFDDPMWSKMAASQAFGALCRQIEACARNADNGNQLAESRISELTTSNQALQTRVRELLSEVRNITGENGCLLTDHRSDINSIRRNHERDLNQRLSTIQTLNQQIISLERQLREEREQHERTLDLERRREEALQKVDRDYHHGRNAAIGGGSLSVICGVSAPLIAVGLASGPIGWGGLGVIAGLGAVLGGTFGAAIGYFGTLQSWSSEVARVTAEYRDAINQRMNNYLQSGRFNTNQNINRQEMASFISNELSSAQIRALGLQRT
ncbi:hypothetical protein CL648_02390 [bacterium]|nr:hypothetical protein [bacterium]